MAQGKFLFSDSPEPSAGDGRKTPAKRGQPTVYSVTQLTRLIKHTLSESLPSKIILEGEISNFKRHGSGHLYLTLKDENAQIQAVMWRSDADRVKFDLSDGLAVIATGRVDVYEPQGKYQFYINTITPSGVGALELAFRQLAQKLAERGLFDESHKKPLPAFPRTIAIVTSDTGAAIKDIDNTLHRRFPIVRKLLYPVPVQGDGAAEAIAAAIRDLNRRCQSLGGIDVMIVARGGGSIEDLWAFNEEIVARAIYDSAIPVISGVGHEIDTTIADLTADRRAATPTAAAELAVPVLADLKQNIYAITQQLQLGMHRQYKSSRNEMEKLSQRPCFSRPGDLVRQFAQQIDEQQEALQRRMIESLRRSERIVQVYAQSLGRIEPVGLVARLRSRLSDQTHQLLSQMREQLQRRTHRLECDQVRLAATGPVRLIPPRRVTLNHLAGRLEQARSKQYMLCRRQLDAIQLRLININPRAILKRGYSITRLSKTGAIVTNSTAVQPGDLLITELANQNIIESQVTQHNPKKESSHG